MIRPFDRPLGVIRVVVARLNIPERPVRPVCDRSCAAAQHVEVGQEQTIASINGPSVTAKHEGLDR